MLLELAILFQQAVRMFLSKKKQQIYTTVLPIIYCHEMQFMWPLFSFLFFFFEKFIYAWKWMDNLQQNELHQISCHLSSIFIITSRRFLALKIISLILFNIIIVSLPSTPLFMLAFLLFLLLILILNLIQLHLLYLYFHGLEINQIKDRLVELYQMRLLFHVINYFLEQTLKYILISNFIRPSTLKLCLVIYIFNIYLADLIFDLIL